MTNYRFCELDDDRLTTDYRFVQLEFRTIYYLFPVQANKRDQFWPPKQAPIMGAACAKHEI
jgi:hypothetical protein